MRLLIAEDDPILADGLLHSLRGQGYAADCVADGVAGPGDAILIPPGAWHQITADQPLRFLCCCAPPYAHEDTYFAAP